MNDIGEVNENKKMTVYTEIDGSRHEVDYPATAKLDVLKVAREIGLPSYLDLSSPMVSSAVVALWASYKVENLSTYIRELKLKGPLTPLLMGGIAVKILSPTSNERGPMNRVVKDIDYVIRREQGGSFVKLLSNLSLIAGSKFHHFLTDSDKRFNAVRAGDRYRIRTLDWGNLNSGKPRVGWVDILVDRVEMRHSIDIREQFGKAYENHYTIGIAKLLVTKCQMIEEIDQAQFAALHETGQEFRLLNYPHYKHGKFLIGMEEKDIMDAVALLCDIVDQQERIASELSSSLRRDEKLQLTFQLNLENIQARKNWLREKGVTESQLSRIDESMESIMRALPKKEKRWDKPWWNRDVETPSFS